ncbi:MAG: GIY-YIG nuclease family protein [candidate division WOR-3 bacterium]
MSRQFYVYLMASKTETLYLGVTADLRRRVYEHKHKLVPGFTARYNINWLVWYEVYEDLVNAITREKQIKRWRREKKETLIRQMNPGWRDLSPAIGVEE